MITLAEQAVRDAEAETEAGTETDVADEPPASDSAPESGLAPLPASEITMELLVPEPPAEDSAEPTVPTAPDTDPDPVSATAATTSDPYAIGPDTHERVADPVLDEEDPVTDKGLPKRTPRITAPVAPPRPRIGSVDAEALRRRLGGFHRGARDGRRDVEAEIAEQTDQSAHTEQPARTAQLPHAEEATGGTVEEASS